VNRKDLIARLASEHSLTTACATRFVDHVFEIIEDALVRGEDVRLYGFGNFSVQTKAARVARNMRTGEPVHVPPKRVAKFTTGETLFSKLQAS
jgi:DNA-binding protein HU-beta